MRLTRAQFTAALLATTLAASTGSAAEKEVLLFSDLAASRLEYDRAVTPFFTQHCLACHNPEKSKGDLSLPQLDSDMKGASAARWAMVAEKLANGEMPPEGKPRPDAASLELVQRWIRSEMKRSGKHFARREAFHNGNSVPHEVLFDAKNIPPYDAPPRIRRLSPEIYVGFADRVNDDATVGQPFSPEGGWTFKDMGAPKVDEPVTSQLIRNALNLAAHQTAYKMENGQLKGLAAEFQPLFDPKIDPTDAQLEVAIKRQFHNVLLRDPTSDEIKRFVPFLRTSMKEAGRENGARYALAAVILMPEAVFRVEVGHGKRDEKGRVRLSGREIAFAIAYAITDRGPDTLLLKAADSGELDTDAGVAKHVRRLLDDPKTQRPTIMRFFREYFGYTSATEVFKDDKANPDHEARALVEDTDRLLEYVLEQDKNVLYELLTTNKAFVGYKKAEEIKRRRIEELAKYEAEKAKDPKKYATKKPPKFGRSVYLAYNLEDFPDQQPVELPAEQRAGILTQPAWLVAQSTADHNHAIFRGKWVRERLLGGVVPDIPITVDAQLPEDPDKTLRQRMAVTQQEYCWKCHILMNDVGLPFETFDHYGRFRTLEQVLDPEATKKNVDPKGKPLGPVERGVPVNATGKIAETGDSRLEGEINGAVQMIRQLAGSERVEQVFVRHVFRFWMGRNESPGDAASLQAAHRAYKDSGGSMKALIEGLLTSEAFLYRVPGRPSR